MYPHYEPLDAGARGAGFEIYNTNLIVDLIKIILKKTQSTRPLKITCFLYLFSLYVFYSEMES